MQTGVFLKKNGKLLSAAASRSAVLLLLLQRSIHLAAVSVATAICQLLHTQLSRAPLNNLNFHHTAPPLVHQLSGGLVDVDGAGIHQRATIVINHVNVGLPLNLESGTQRVDGPVGSCTAYLVGILQRSADCVAGAISQVVALRVSVCGCAYNSVSLRGVIERHAMLVSPKVRILRIGLG